MRIGCQIASRVVLATIGLGLAPISQTAVCACISPDREVTVGRVGTSAQSTAGEAECVVCSNYSIGAGNSYGPLVSVVGAGDITGTAGADHPGVGA